MATDTKCRRCTFTLDEGPHEPAEECRPCRAPQEHHPFEPEDSIYLIQYQGGLPYAVTSRLDVAEAEAKRIGGVHLQMLLIEEAQ